MDRDEIVHRLKLKTPQEINDLSKWIDQAERNIAHSHRPLDDAEKNLDIVGELIDLVREEHESLDTYQINRVLLTLCPGLYPFC